MPVSAERLRELYDRVSLRVTRGYKPKFERIASEAGLTTTGLFEQWVDLAEKKSTRASKKERKSG